MIRKLTIENFQSHSHTELNLFPGVNVILGETDSGKSAVVRALRWLWFNEPRGDGFVRRGARNCRVRAEFGDGAAVERAREGSRNLYRVVTPGGREEVYEGFGSAVPEEAARAAGAVRVEANGVTLTPSLANQMDPPFVIGESPATAAAVVGLVSRAEAFDAALRDANADAARLKREARSLEEEVAAFGRQLEEFADLPAWEEALAGAGAALDAARRAEARKERLLALAAAQRDALAEIAAAEAVLDAAEGIDTAAVIAAAVGGKTAHLKALKALRSAYVENEAAIRESEAVLKRTLRVEEAARTCGDAAEALARMKRLEELRRGRRDAAAELAGAEARLRATSGAGDAGRALAAAAETLSRLGVLRSLAASAGEASRELSSAERAVEATKGLREAGELLDGVLQTLRRLDSLYVLVKGSAAAAWEASEAQSEVEKAASLAGRATEDLAAALAELGRCPVCFRTIERGEIDGIIKNFVDR